MCHLDVFSVDDLAADNDFLATNFSNSFFIFLFSFLHEKSIDYYNYKN